LSFFLAAPLALRAADPVAAAPAPATVDALLKSLQPLGIDVIYSSELVPPGMLAPAARAGSTPLQHANEALAANGLALRILAPNRYVVVRASATPAPAPVPANAPMEEISVYASRYSIEGRVVAEPRNLNSSDIERVPGSHDDALRALKSLPGLAGNVSGRPYIRGSLADDVLVRYDGITLLDPFHLKNFQSLISAIDPAAVDRIDVFSGGFPVRYGTRSGGVIDISAPERDAGYENRAAASLISAGVSSIGRSETLPLDWLLAVRRSTLDLLDTIKDDFGQPQFSDSLGRLRWSTDKGAWTAGWLLLDDQIQLGKADNGETARARYRDEYFWLARDHTFNPELHTRATLVFTNAERSRDGVLDEPGVATGTVDQSTEFERLEFNNLWTWEPQDHSTYTFGAEASESRAQYEYTRAARYAPLIAAAFERGLTNDLSFAIDPQVFTYALHAAARRQWASFEAEVGLRLDGEDYNFGGDHSQVSPRLNLRYDANDRWRIYATVGRFTQPQHVEEWRVEEAQSVADAAQVSNHAVLGLTFAASKDTQLGVELYDKHWTTVSPYFDNLLDPLSLSPDLAPDRIRLDPNKSEAAGVEINYRQQFSERLSGWGTLSWSRVADEIDSEDVLRSWDQPLALTAGVSWQGARLNLSALGAWHRGWPRTPFELIAPSNVAPGEFVLGSRSSGRWGDFYSLDFRGSYTWPLAQGDFSTVLEVTNASNRKNECCASLSATDDGTFIESDTGHWLPTILNLGFSYRWRGPR
jgi:outer membrane receptor protein involved in Fe transport